MARKKKHEEHENLERWLVSYADFMTLLFATFVVLYALSQVDVASFSKIEEAIKKAFDAPSILVGKQTVLPEEGSKVIGEKSSSDSLLDTLFMEYISPKYEEQSFEEIKSAIDSLKKSGDYNNIDAKITSRGLVININDNSLMFNSGSADLTSEAKKKLDIISSLIGQKFMMHLIRVEGHTDNLPVTNLIYPSNWELSSARSCTIVRYMIDNYKFLPDLFTPIGYGDTRPIADNKTENGRRKNRRIEIVVLKNKSKQSEEAKNSILKMTKSQQKTLRDEQLEAINKILNPELNTKIDKSKNNIQYQDENIKIFDINILDENLYRHEIQRLENPNNKNIYLKPKKKSLFK